LHQFHRNRNCDTLEFLAPSQRSNVPSHASQGGKIMPRKIKPKAKAKPKSKAGKQPAKRSSRKGPRKTAVKRAARSPSPAPSLSREVIEEILVHSSNASEGEWLSDRALSEIAVCGNLEPSRVLEVHRRLCEAAEDSGVTIVRVVELWDPYE
jgi:hypothetical protein